MYKIVIIDDEKTVHEGLTDAIDWEVEGCMIAGKAYNGPEGIKMVDSVRPDILITDIRMPGLDGLKLSEYVKTHYPETQIVLLTGYGEFSYAQKAIQLGVFEYLLKPTRREELLRTIRNAKKCIELEQKRKEEIVKLNRQIRENLPALRENYLRNLLTQTVPDVNKQDDIQRKVRVLDINVDKYVVIAMEIDLDNVNKVDDGKRKLLERIALKNICSELINPFKGSCFIEVESNLFVCIINSHQCNSVVESIAEQIQEKMKAVFDITVSFGISDSSCSIVDIGKLFKQAKSALEHKFHFGTGSVICYSDLKVISDVKNNNYSHYFREIVKYVKVGDTENVVKYTDILFEQYKNNNKNIDFIKNSVIELTSSIYTSFSREFLIKSDSEWVNVYIKLFKLETLINTKAFIMGLVKNLSNAINNELKSRSNYVIDEVLKYLENNYHRDIKLTDLSEIVYMNSSYLSRLIKKECKENFSELLSKIRIEKAKDMLKSSNLKVYEVAEAVGIHDAKYFALMFKKITGMNPTEYREGSVGIFDE